ncbi:hypothetical protein BX661DRAFT_168045 [Kickxella alabastrina]|uniref:uncharacterized protein n=1 Tax=Kickxella alabastrina TaxID=61397 RepID=UPI0022209B56|nr:uncharacterized protein BX661DRAFT_168045 [Kickxella alabastrina]KAI7834846.1 hypothetical protein BX661DRAFT_168045 [Kickxella alabastrina]
MPSAGDKSLHGLENVLGNFEAFLAASSGIEGAEMQDDHPDEDHAESSDEDIDMDADGIIYALMEAIGASDIAGLDGAIGLHKNELPRNGGQVDAAATRTTDNTAASLPTDICSMPMSANNDNGSTDKDAPDDIMAIIMDSMDQELAATHIGKSFVHCNPADGSEDTDSADGHDDDMLDVDVDLNLVDNIVQSFRAQEGLPGPAGTMLGHFGVHLPHIDSDSDSEDGI